MDTGSLVLLLFLAGIHADSTLLKLRWEQDEGFLADLNVGTPAQLMTVQVTNSMTHIHVIGDKCSSCVKTDKVFSPARSTSYAQNSTIFDVDTADGRVFGHFGEDVISTSSGFSLGRQQVGVATAEKLDYYHYNGQQLRAGGILGIGVDWPLTRQVSSKGIYDAVGSSNVTFRVDASGETGELLLGAQKHAKCSEDVHLHKQLSCKIGKSPNGLYIYGDCLKFDKLSPVPDTCYGCTKSNGIGRFSFNEETWGVPNYTNFDIKFMVENNRVICPTYDFNVHVVIDGAVYPVPATEFIKKEGNKCTLAVHRSSSVVIPKQFFRHYCVSYDQKSKVIGIAKAL